MKTSDNKNIKKNARIILNRGWTGPVMVALILVTLTLLATALMIPFASQKVNRTWNLIAGIGVEFILYLILRLFFFGADAFLLKSIRKADPSYGDLLTAFRHDSNRYLIVGLVQMAIPAAGILVGVGLFGLYTAGNTFALPFFLIWCVAAVLLTFYLELGFALAPALLLDNPGMSGGEALVSSRKLMKGKKKQLCLLLLSFLPWIFLMLFTLGIGELWILPYLMTSELCFYEKLLYPAELPEG